MRNPVSCSAYGSVPVLCQDSEMEPVLLDRGPPAQIVVLGARGAPVDREVKECTLPLKHLVDDAEHRSVCGVDRPAGITRRELRVERHFIGIVRVVDARRHRRDAAPGVNELMVYWVAYNLDLLADAREAAREMRGLDVVVLKHVIGRNV